MKARSRSITAAGARCGFVALVISTFVAAANPPASAEAIDLTCSFEAGRNVLAKSLPDSFCSALRLAIEKDLRIAIRKGGHPVSVKLRPRSAYALNVTVKAAPMRGGKAVTQTSVLTSHDRPVNPSSARTLVRMIALQLGVI
jgi:hypothetical protein